MPHSERHPVIVGPTRNGACSTAVRGSQAVYFNVMVLIFPDTVTSARTCAT